MVMMAPLSLNVVVLLLTASVKAQDAQFVFDCTRNIDDCAVYETSCQQQCSDYYKFSLPRDGNMDASVTPKHDVEDCTCYDGTYDQESSEITINGVGQAQLQEDNGNPLNFHDNDPNEYFTDGAANFQVKVYLTSSSCDQSFVCTMRCNDGYCHANPSLCGCGGSYQYWAALVSILWPIFILFILFSVLGFMCHKQCSSGSSEESATTEDPLLAESQTGYGGLNQHHHQQQQQQQQQQHVVNNRVNNDNELERELEREFRLKEEIMEKKYMEQEADLALANDNNDDADSDVGPTNDAISAWFDEHDVSSSAATLTAMHEIGVVNPNDMSELDEDDVNVICATLKKISAKRFRRALAKLRTESATASSTGVSSV